MMLLGLVPASSKKLIKQIRIEFLKFKVLKKSPKKFPSFLECSVKSDEKIDSVGIFLHHLWKGYFHVLRIPIELAHSMNN